MPVLKSIEIMERVVLPLKESGVLLNALLFLSSHACFTSLCIINLQLVSPNIGLMDEVVLLLSSSHGDLYNLDDLLLFPLPCNLLLITGLALSSGVIAAEVEYVPFAEEDCVLSVRRLLLEHVARLCFLGFATHPLPWNSFIENGLAKRSVTLHPC